MSAAILPFKRPPQSPSSFSPTDTHTISAWASRAILAGWSVSPVQSSDTGVQYLDVYHEYAAEPLWQVARDPEGVALMRWEDGEVFLFRSVGAALRAIC